MTKRCKGKVNVTVVCDVDFLVGDNADQDYIDNLAIIKAKRGFSELEDFADVEVRELVITEV